MCPHKTVAGYQNNRRYFKYVHCAPPCNTFSNAVFPKLRSAAHPMGLRSLRGPAKAKVGLGNKIARNTMEVAGKFALEDSMVSIENPNSSYLWKTKHYKALLRRMRIAGKIVHEDVGGLVWRDCFCGGMGGVGVDGTGLAGWRGRGPSIPLPTGGVRPVCLGHLLQEGHEAVHNPHIGRSGCPQLPQ